MNSNKIWHGKSGSAHEIVISGLYYGDIKVKDTFVYEYTWASNQKLSFSVLFCYQGSTDFVKTELNQIDDVYTSNSNHGMQQVMLKSV